MKDIEAAYAQALADIDAVTAAEIAQAKSADKARVAAERAVLRTKEAARLEAQKAVELALRDDEELGPYPPGKTVTNVIAEGLIRMPQKKEQR